MRTEPSGLAPVEDDGVHSQFTSQKGKMVNSFAKEGLKVLITAAVATVVVVLCFGFLLKPSSAPVRAAKPPDTNAIVLLKMKFSALVKDTHDGPDAKWSDKPITIEALCTGFIVKLDGRTASVFTAGHCVSEGGAADDIKKQASMKNDPIAAIFHVVHTDGILTKSPDSDDPVSREVLVFRGDNVSGSRFSDPDSPPLPDPDNAVKASVEDELPVDVSDSALLSVHNLPGPLSVLQLADSQGNVGDPVAATGFPASPDDNETDHRLMTTFGHITSVPKVWRANGADSFTADAQITNGMSGGPVTNADGRVIGFNDKFAPKIPMETYPTNLADMKLFLGKYGIHAPQQHHIVSHVFGE